MSGTENVPGPPAPPRCRECGRLVSHQGHAIDCERGKDQHRHVANVQAVRVALEKAINARRQDRPFMERLAARLAADERVLERLAEEDG